MIKRKNISKYSSLTTKELSNLHDQFTAKYGIALNNTTRSIEERRIIRLITEIIKNRKEQKKELCFIREFVKEYIYREIKEYSLITYLAMKKCYNFEQMGEQRVSISFCRIILGIQNDCAVTQFDADRFNHIVEECDKRNKYKSGEEYSSYLRNYKLKLFGRDYCHDELMDINAIFYLLGADYFLFRYIHDDYGSEFIFGKVYIKELGNDRAFIIQEEYIRSPQLVLSIAARTYNNIMLIRNNACELIFFNKWQKHYGQSKAECERALQHVNSSIREGFKEKALNYYNARNTFDVLNTYDIFIKDMSDGIFWHEIGHHLANGEMDPLHNVFRVFFAGEDNIGSALEEALADWAPAKDSRMGSFAHFIKISKTDILKAVGNIYTYLSDNWFVDEEEEFLSVRSNILTGLTFIFINPDGSVNFDKLEKEYLNIYIILQERFNILSNKSIDIIHNSIYELDDRSINYKMLENELYDYYQYTKEGCSLEKLHKNTSYWDQVFMYLKKYSKEGWDKYQKLLEAEYNLTETIILKMANTKSDSLRKYIIERSKETGVIKMIPQDIDKTIKIPPITPPTKPQTQQ
uniref:Uncharacterized protein n=1 Tax=uncultured bacterium contig00043 TaxID=1181530 RepID=A0A806KDF8_9BACT|nr:hypothetical protein [uncultured bacterium contig00043]